MNEDRLDLKEVKGFRHALEFLLDASGAMGADEIMMKFDSLIEEVERVREGSQYTSDLYDQARAEFAGDMGWDHDILKDKIDSLTNELEDVKRERDELADGIIKWKNLAKGYAQRLGDAESKILHLSDTKFIPIDGESPKETILKLEEKAEYWSSECERVIKMLPPEEQIKIIEEWTK